MFSIIGIIGSGCSQTDRIGLVAFTRRRTVKIQQMTKYILGGVIAVGLTFFCASSNAQAKEKKMNEALTINGDGAFGVHIESVSQENFVPSCNLLSRLL